MGTSSGMGWAGRLLIGLLLIVAGAAVAVWALARYDSAARFLGVTHAPAVAQGIKAPPPRQALPVTAPPSPQAGPADASRLSQLEARVAQVERTSQAAVGSAGRADALVVAFAARRAIDRGKSLGFLENLLVDRFGGQHAAAVATIIAASRSPVRLDELTEEYARLEPQLRGGGPQESWWAGFRRGFGSLVEIRHADKPSTKPETRYRRAVDQLSAGHVEAALAETMRLPGSQDANAWAAKARRYIAAHRALDELESAALMSGFSSH